LSLVAYAACLMVLPQLSWSRENYLLCGLVMKSISHPGLWTECSLLAMPLRYRMMSDSSTSSKVSCTPAFQPPEALLGGAGEDPISADVWALGVCLYCFIYGRLPFRGSCLLDMSNAIRTEEVSAVVSHRYIRLTTAWAVLCCRPMALCRGFCCDAQPAWGDMRAGQQMM
jgi:serine/threonine protein kinase